jgi:mannobiose 2-epimerase
MLAGGIATLALAVPGRGAGALPPIGCGPPPCAFTPVADWTGARQALRDILTRNYLPFWRRLADESRGEGYDLNHDLAGRWLGPSDPALVAQARMLWFFAHLRRRGHAEAADEARAARGFKILTERFLDPTHGGYFWRLQAADLQPRQADKQLYGQTFALFALSEHALAGGDAASSAAADAAFAAIDANLRDPALANYHEFRSRDWALPTAGSRDYLGQPIGERTQNTRIHLLEALTTYHELRPTPLVRARLAEVVALTEGALRRNPAYFFRESDTPPYTRQAYGHDVEALHLLLRARARLGRCGTPPAFYRRVLADALRLGEDAEFGGLFHSGPPGLPPERRERIDWVQAETLLTLATFFRLERDPAHEAAFLRLLNWIGRWQADWRDGSWYPLIDSDLRPGGQKADAWRDPYHAARALVGCLRLIGPILKGTVGGCVPV